VQNNNTNSHFSRLREIPPAIWALGFVSMLMDISSEIIHVLLPVYLVSVLGASMLTVGFIEGIAEATASITKVFFRRALGLVGQAQIARAYRVWIGSLHQADISTCTVRKLARDRALH